MIKGGNATIFVSDMDRAVRFYTESLGLKLQYRAGDHWAQVEAGDGLCIGLHPAGPDSPRPGSGAATHRAPRHGGQGPSIARRPVQGAGAERRTDQAGVLRGPGWERTLLVRSCVADPCDRA